MHLFKIPLKPAQWWWWWGGGFNLEHVDGQADVTFSYMCSFHTHCAQDAYKLVIKMEHTDLIACTLTEARF
jgi:hypothetical protein